MATSAEPGGTLQFLSIVVILLLLLLSLQVNAVKNPGNYNYPWQKCGKNIVCKGLTSGATTIELIGLRRYGKFNVFVVFDTTHCGFIVSNTTFDSYHHQVNITKYKEQLSLKDFLDTSWFYRKPSENCQERGKNLNVFFFRSTLESDLRDDEKGNDATMCVISNFSAIRVADKYDGYSFTRAGIIKYPITSPEEIIFSSTDDDEKLYGLVNRGARGCLFWVEIKYPKYRNDYTLSVIHPQEKSCIDLSAPITRGFIAGPLMYAFTTDKQIVVLKRTGDSIALLTKVKIADFFICPLMPPPDNISVWWLVAGWLFMILVVLPVPMMMITVCIIIIYQYWGNRHHDGHSSKQSKVIRSKQIGHRQLKKRQNSLKSKASGSGPKSSTNGSTREQKSNASDCGPKSSTNGSTRKQKSKASGNGSKSSTTGSTRKQKSKASGNGSKSSTRVVQPSKAVSLTAAK